MADFAQAAAVVLAAVFGWAAVAKLRTLPSTTEAFRGLGLPAAPLLARVLPIVELMIAVGLVVAPAVTSWAALVLVLVFSVVVARAVASRSTVSCACFGMSPSSATDDARPVSVVELVRNAGLGGLAIVASGAGAGGAWWPTLPALLVVTALVALARIALAIIDRRRSVSASG